MLLCFLWCQDFRFPHNLHHIYTLLCHILFFELVPNTARTMNQYNVVVLWVEHHCVLLIHWETYVVLSSLLVSSSCRCYAQVLMKIRVPRACTTKVWASYGSGLGSTSRDCVPRGSISPRPALKLNVYHSEAGLGGAVQSNYHKNNTYKR